MLLQDFLFIFIFYNNLNNYLCRGTEPKSSLSMFILSLKPKLRIMGCPKRVNIVKGAHVSK